MDGQRSVSEGPEMTQMKLHKAIKRVTILRQEPSGEIVPLVLERKSKRKKQSKRLKMMEKITRQIAQATMTFAETYSGQHQKSNRKKKDGWFRDLTYNLSEARRKSDKKLRLEKLLFG
ncbi:MAG TPA: hypothetical protein VD972_09180 [Hyalangium sp.]|nr:hypothetical protein [Hyalangium sp.]